MKKVLFVVLILAMLLSGCIDRNPANAVERAVYGPIAAVLIAANPGDAVITDDPKHVVRVYLLVWGWEWEHER